MTSRVPSSRIRLLNDLAVNAQGGFVLYWMTSARRLRYNFALQRAVELAVDLGKPLLVLEALASDYPWANDRLHRFVMDGMVANARLARGSRARYFAYVEPTPRGGRGLVRELSRAACVVVTDHFPAFFLPRIAKAAAAASAVRVEAVDGNGLIPLSAHGKAFTAARSYRAFVQRELRGHLRNFPDEQPLHRLPRALARADVPDGIRDRWPETGAASMRGAGLLASLPIDHDVPPAPARGGSEAAADALREFLADKLRRYGSDHNHPDADCTSRLSPYLHFGHLSAHEIFAAVMKRERWTTRRLGTRGGGARDGWWGVGDSANVFLDQLVVWRELAFNGCEWMPGIASYESVPDWARQTLAEHADDERRQYDFETLEGARTHDEVWNAAQRQLAAEGWFHGYLRMLWGKKILEWAPNPPAALEWMDALMNRYSLDGRDPVSYASFAWVLGRYDRPWPAQPIFGTVRAMSSQSAKRKLRMREFLARYGTPAATSAGPSPAARR